MDQISPSLIRQQCMVDGRWIGEPETAVYNPATGAAIARVPNFGAAETKAAIEAAHRAFPAWSGLLAKERSAILRRWFELQLQHAEELARLMTAEQGKPLAEARGEVAYGASFVEFFAEEAKRVYGETIPYPQKGRAHHRPQAAHRRRWRDHALEFPLRDDHTQGLAGARNRLHRGRQACAGYAADGSGAGGAGCKRQAFPMAF